MSGSWTSDSQTRRVRQSRSVSAGRVCSAAQCELRQHGLTSLQRGCHPLLRSSAADLCQRDKWHHCQEVDGRNVLFRLFGRTGSKQHFTLGGRIRKESTPFKVPLLFPKSLCCARLCTLIVLVVGKFPRGLEKSVRLFCSHLMNASHQTLQCFYSD